MKEMHGYSHGSDVIFDEVIKMGLMFFLSGRCKWEVLHLTQSFEPRKLSSGEKTKLFTVVSISIRSPRPSTYKLMDEHPGVLRFFK